MRWTVLENETEVAHAACDRIVSIAKQAIESSGQFHIVLAGGTTPAATYALLAKQHCKWECWHVWFGDERCLPVGHEDRNSTMVQDLFTGKVPIPADQVHGIPAELGPEAAAKQYASITADRPPFDLVILGMGEDGHTASLFPGTDYAKDVLVLPVFNAPKQPAQRVSMSAELISRSCHLLLLITGASKHDAVMRWQQGEPLPVSLVNGIETTEVLIDSYALGHK